MKNELLIKIEDLEDKIINSDISVHTKHVKKWGGADVIIGRELDEGTRNWLGDQSYVISLQRNGPKRRAVITEYYKELSWLFYQLKEIFSEHLDYVSKYEFYGSLAQSAIDYLSDNEVPEDNKMLLIEVINTAKGFCEIETSE